METFIAIGLLIVLMYLEFRTRRITRERIESVKQSLNDRMSNVDRNFSKLVERDRKNNHKFFNNILALAGYAKIMVENEGDLVLVEDFKGNKFIADTKVTPLRFVPAKEVKVKKGVNLTEYKGKTYEFEAVEKKVSPEF